MTTLGVSSTTAQRVEAFGVMAMRRLAALVAVVTLLSGLTACSTGERVDLGGESSGNLIAAIAGEPDQLDPHKTSAYFSFEVLENVYDTLVEPDANLEMKPALAESWTVSPDQLSWTFHLRSGVTFHDGSPFTADDVVYSYRRIIDEQLTNSDKFSAVADVSAPDPVTVVIRLKQPTPNLLTNIGGFKGMAIVQRRNVESGQITTHPIGTGPFSFVGQKSGDSITLKANPSYWGGPPNFGRDVPVHLRADDRTFGAAGRRDRLDRLDSPAARGAAARRRLDELGGHREQRLLVSRAQRETQAVGRRAGASGRRVRHRPRRDRGGDELWHRGDEPARDPRGNPWYTDYHRYGFDVGQGQEPVAGGGGDGRRSRHAGHQ